MRNTLVALAWSLLATTSAKAAYDVTIVGTGSSSGGAWVGNTWTASASGAQVLASEIATHLASGATAVGTGASGSENGNIVVAAGATLGWNANTLTLRAARNITVNAAMAGTAAAGLALEYGQGTGGGGGASYQSNGLVSIEYTGLFSTKLGSSGATDLVPRCAVAGRFGTIYGCSFLKNSNLAALTVNRSSVQVNASSDSDKWVYIDGRGFFGAGSTYYPFVMACQAGQGQLNYPTSKSQASYFGSTGTITDQTNLDANTTLVRTCKTWDDGPVLPLLSSADFPNGYYFKFRPNTGESGAAYQTVRMLFAAMPEANTGYTVVDYVINVLDTTPDAFSFPAVTGAALSTATVSSAVTVTGINSATPVSISGAEYAVSSNAGVTWGSYTASAGTVGLNDRVRVRLVSSASQGVTTVATLTIGGVSGAFRVTTLPAATPDPVPAPTIAPLPVTIPGVSTRTGIVNMADGAGPAFMADLVAMLANALGQPLQYIGQSAQGTVTLRGYHGGNLAFVPNNFQGRGDTRANGVYALGDGRYQAVRNEQVLTLAPALVHLDQLTALFPGLAATVEDNGVIIATANGVTYAMLPGVAVQLEPTDASARLELGADGRWHFVDAQGNNQILYPAFADAAMLRSALLGLDTGVSVSMQLDGTATVVLKGQRYTLVPDLTLSQVPAERVGQYWWQESATRFWVSNSQPLGTAQGFTVRQ